jgi:hypothetical protein
MAAGVGIDERLALDPVEALRVGRVPQRQRQDGGEQHERQAHVERQPGWHPGLVHPDLLRATGGSALAAPIHFAQTSVSGAVVAFLCGGGGKPAYPAVWGTVTGTIVAADVLAVPTQGIAAGDLGAVLRAVRAGVTYANVDSVAFPGGEIRGQIPGGGNRDHGNGD